MNVIWIHGPSGIGKTVLAHTMAGKEDVYWKKEGSIWWEGYDAHSVVVIDDIRADWWPFTYVLGLLDTKPMRVECKGSSRQFLAETIIITSLEAPQYTFGTVGNEPVRQLVRRITRVIDMQDLPATQQFDAEPEEDDPFGQYVPDVPEVAEVIIETLPVIPALSRAGAFWGSTPTYASAYDPVRTNWDRGDDADTVLDGDL